MPTVMTDIGVLHAEVTQHCPSIVGNSAADSKLNNWQIENRAYHRERTTRRNDSLRAIAMFHAEFIGQLHNATMDASA